MGGIRSSLLTKGVIEKRVNDGSSIVSRGMGKSANTLAGSPTAAELAIHST